MSILRYPGESNNAKAFHILQHINPDTAKACLTKADKQQASGTILKWLDGSAMPKQYSDLLDLCGLLECDVAYLLGAQSEYNKGTCDAAVILGLSSNAIEKMKKYNDTIRMLICELTLGEEDLLRKLLLELSYTARFSGGYFAWSHTGADEPHRIKDYMSDNLFRSAILFDIGKILDKVKERTSNCQISEKLKMELKLSGAIYDAD